MIYIIEICLLGRTKYFFCSNCNHLMVKSHSNIWRVFWSIIILMIWNIGIWFSLLMVKARAATKVDSNQLKFFNREVCNGICRTGKNHAILSQLWSKLFFINLSKAFWYFYFCLNISIFTTFRIHCNLVNTAYALGQPVWNKHIFYTDNKRLWIISLSLEKQKYLRIVLTLHHTFFHILIRNPKKVSYLTIFLLYWYFHFYRNILYSGNFNATLVIFKKEKFYHPFFLN